MPSVRDLRRKVKSVRSTQQITKAMKMVAAARLQRAQGRILAARPFAEKMRELMTDLRRQLSREEGGAAYSHPYLAAPQEPSGRVGLIAITADKGLCGSFNTNVLRKCAEFISKRPGTLVFSVGRKARDLFRGLPCETRGEYVGIFSRLGFAHAELIGKDVMEAYTGERLDSVQIIYNEFKSIVQPRLVVDQLLPIGDVIPRESEGEISNFLYEPGREKLLDALLPRSVKAQIFRSLLESAAAELAARMTAMDAATRNASELIESLTLTMNKVRQTGITKEISELVAGAEALK
jgi:F-type H+-transporting ATPase subunit gamma